MALRKPSKRPATRASAPFDPSSLDLDQVLAIFAAHGPQIRARLEAKAAAEGVPIAGAAPIKPDAKSDKELADDLRAELTKVLESVARIMDVATAAGFALGWNIAAVDGRFAVQNVRLTKEY